MRGSLSSDSKKYLTKKRNGFNMNCVQSNRAIQNIFCSGDFMDKNVILNGIALNYSIILNRIYYFKCILDVNVF